MRRFLRWVRGALGMGLAWAVGWGFVGGMIELASNLGLHLPWFSAVDMWPQTLAIPGFLGGALFSVVLRIAAGQRTFGELSVKRFAVWGALTGAAAGAALVGAGLLAPVFPSLLIRAAVVLIPFTVLSAGCAAGTLAIAQRVTERDPARLLERSESARGTAD